MTAVMQTIPDFARALDAGVEHRRACPQCARGGKDDALAVKVDDDGRGGAFHCHRCGHSGNWHEPINGAKRPAARMRPTSKPEDHAALWESGVELGEVVEHPYLIAKQVNAHGIRIKGDLLLVPMWGKPTIEHEPLPFGGLTQQLVGVQTIAPDGSKRYTRGTKKAGAFHLIGDNLDERIAVAEGYATGASIYEATGIATAIAFDCGNLTHVAKALREKFPDLLLVVCADDDYRTEGNPGLTKATEAARAVGGFVAAPDFGDDRPEGATDFNDLARHRGAEAVIEALHRGAEAVIEALERATAPDVGEGQPKAQSAPAWPEPQPLPDGLASVEPFDSAMLPASLRGWVDDISERVQCPPDFVAVAAVVAMGSVLGRKIAIRPQEHTPWAEVANQWGLIIGRPGVMKSPAIEQAIAPLRRIEATARERHASEMDAFRADEIARKLRAKANERDAEKAIAKNRNADISKLLQLDDEGRNLPTCRRYATSDTSMESLAELVRQNPAGLLVHRDEMVSLLRDLDREEKAGARGFYLTGWNGSTSYTVDRIGRGFDLHIPAVCLSMLGGTQPGRLAEYVNTAMRGGAGDDGLIQRFGLAVWPDLAGEWRNVDRWPDTRARRDVFEAFVRLDELTPEAVSTAQDTDHNGEPEGTPYLRLADDARDEFVGWRSDLERRLRSGELGPALESHLAKYRKLVPALALLFHVADGGAGPVALGALQRALAWAEYLESHARRIYGSGMASEAATAKAILARIRKGDLTGEFSSRDVWRPGWAGLSDREAVAKGLSLLVDFDHLRAERMATAGRTATRYAVNPRALQ